jgi:hypothetical protein
LRCYVCDDFCGDPDYRHIVVFVSLETIHSSTNSHVTMQHYDTFSFSYSDEIRGIPPPTVWQRP